MEIFAFYDIALEPIKLQDHSASQNDRLNLSFVKDTYVPAKKMARKVGKIVIYESQILGLTLYYYYYYCICCSDKNSVGHFFENSSKLPPSSAFSY